MSHLDGFVHHFRNALKNLSRTIRAGILSEGTVFAD